MSKIKQTTFLPYTKSRVPSNAEARTQNISNSLSEKEPEKTTDKGETLGLLSAVSAYRDHIKTPNNFHSGAAIKAWRKRKQ